MAQSLSAATGREIEYVTRLCQRLEFFANCPPLSLNALSHGDSNQSYVIHTGRADYVLRCYSSDIAVCRQQELRCQHAAAAAQLAPAPLCLNNHYQVLISEFIAGGEPFNAAHHGMQPLLQQLVQYHQLQVQTPQLDNLAYLKQLQKPVVASTEPHLLDALHRAALALTQQGSDEVLCHLDLHAGNLLWAEGRLWLLDFEYSQRADSCLDLAAICLHFSLDNTAQLQLLQHYARLRNQPALLNQLAVKIADAKVLYAGFCWLWYLAQPNCQDKALHWQQQLELLL